MGCGRRTSILQVARDPVQSIFAGSGSTPRAPSAVPLPALWSWSRNPCDAGLRRWRRPSAVGGEYSRDAIRC